MVKLSFCSKTAELRAMAYDGRSEEARRKAIELLRAGYSHKLFLAFVADLLDPPVKGRGAPSRPPREWLDIGDDYENLRDDGRSHQDALMDLAEKYSVAERTVERAVAIYREAKAEHFVDDK
ncbi:hypothetical protein I6F15_00770 [Bradyrhizobium sp. BRP14]|nr:hypothetical protein [Bradyrhizobium sp. BRP14]